MLWKEGPPTPFDYESCRQYGTYVRHLTIGDKIARYFDSVRTFIHSNWGGLVTPRPFETFTGLPLRFLAVNSYFTERLGQSFPHSNRRTNPPIATILSNSYASHHLESPVHGEFAARTFTSLPRRHSFLLLPVFYVVC
ncbi:hypothetical protein BDN72DRAFT_845181 [Pluteus cervinus]|uniref:Uncharacterized protein n=1 Tax=Pluteus cervinus TaxID=181527 RepID=A0ACD3AJF9_9AGAR|nr:hypothetical protein BDN72DRAFT_845181 [Pluteus cervinus]